jgi:hypothetical protein
MPGLGGAWRSLVAHLLWEQGVGGSNPLAPTAKLTGPRREQRGCSSTVEPQPSKLVMGVRFPSPALAPSGAQETTRMQHHTGIIVGRPTVAGTPLTLLCITLGHYTCRVLMAHGEPRPFPCGARRQSLKRASPPTLGRATADNVAYRQANQYCNTAMTRSLPMGSRTRCSRVRPRLAGPSVSAISRSVMNGR